MATIPDSFYLDPDEKLQGVLGQGLITSLITGGGLGKSMMVLTDRRLYVQGKIYQKAGGLGGANFVVVKGKQTVPVSNITGTGFQERDPKAILILSWIIGILAILILALLLVVLRFGVNDVDNKGDWVAWILSLMVTAAFCWVIYRIGCKRFFFVEYSGGSMATDCNWHSSSEIDEFQRLISRGQDKIKSVDPSPQDSQGTRVETSIPEGSNNQSASDVDADDPGRFCGNCGRQRDLTANFCKNCGTRY